MSFNDNASLDTSRVGGGGGGGGRGPVAAGGGILGLIALIIYLFTGTDITGGGGGAPDPGQNPGQSQQTRQAGQDREGADRLAAKCKTGADANKDVECRMVATENSLYDFWSQQPDLAKDLKDANQKFREPSKVNIYQGQMQSQCGTASNQIGPFYCPLDEGIFLDASFFQVLEKQLGASNGALAQEYVLAHEYGHHIQNIYGVLDEAQKDPKGKDSGAVRVELMADCFAGLWIQHATETKDKDGNVLLKDITEKDIQDAQSAAKAVGDDQIQQKSGGMVNPESWTHGSAKARQAWLGVGLKAKSLNECDTFEVRDPENP